MIGQETVALLSSTGPIQANGPNQKWLTGFAFGISLEPVAFDASLWTAEGWLYVAPVLDLFSRRIVGWSPPRS